MRKLILIPLILIALQAEARNWYFSSITGNDTTGTGTLAAPYRSITKLNTLWATIAAGDSILFRRGETFFGTINPAKSGTTALPIVISAYNTGAKPILTGFTTVSTFTSIQTNIWESSQITTAPAALNVVTVASNLVGMGRWPDYNGIDGGYRSVTSSTSLSRFTDASLINTPNWTGAQVVLKCRRFVIDILNVSSHVGTQVNYASTLSTYIPTAGFGYFFQNSAQTLTVQNEWYYNPTSQKIRFWSTVNPNTLGIQVATLTNVINHTSRSNIKYVDLHLRGATGNVLQLNSGINNYVLNCLIEKGGDCGIFGGSGLSNTLIDGNEVRDNLNQGVETNNGHVTITNNNIHNNSMIVGMGKSGENRGSSVSLRHLDFQATVKYNTIKNSGYCGIIFKNDEAEPNCDSVYIKFNLIDSSLQNKDDGGGIYSWAKNAPQYRERYIDSNIILNSTGTKWGTGQVFASGYGIYWDLDTRDIVMRGNLTDSSGRAGQFLNYGVRGITANGNGYFASGWNMGSDARGCQMYINEDETHKVIQLNNFQNNIFWQVGSTANLLRFDNDTTIKVPFGTLNNNKYVNNSSRTSPFVYQIVTYPIVNNQPKRTLTTTNRNFASWQTYTGFDAASTQRLTANTTIQRVFYNATKNTVGIALPVGTWQDVYGVNYSGTVSFPPYTWKILIYTGGQITPVINWNNPAAITYGTPLSGTQLNATVTPSIAGTFSYSPASGTVLNAGTHTLSVTFTPQDQVTYTSATKQVTIVVNKASATLSYSGALTVVYNGLPQGATVTTNPAGLTVINTLYNGVGATPVNAGTYSMVTSLTNANYTAANITGTFAITKATASLTVSNTTQTYNGSQRPVTVVTSPVGLTGVVVSYDGSTTPPTNAGTYAVIANLVNANYTAPTVNTTLTVNKATPTVSWSTPSAITYPTALSGTQLNATASVAGTFTYTPASGTILNAGTQTLSVNFTPTDATNYNSVNNTTVQIVVNKGTATLSLSNTSQVYDGTGKAVTVTTNPVGLGVVSITYNGSATLPINAGSYTVSATLNNSNYNATPATGTLTITKAIATLFISNLTQTYDGTTQPVTVTTSPAGLTTVTTTYNGSTTAPTNAGSYSVIASLSNANYQATNATGTLVINKATPNVNWNNPSSITYGTALSFIQLNAIANTAGSFAYTPPLGTVLNAGTHILSTDFTPTDATNWNSVNDVTVTIIVNKATATITLSNLGQVYDGTPKSATATTNPVGLNTVTITYDGSGTAPTNAGTYAVVASLSNANYTATNATGNLVIAKAQATITLSNLTQTYDGTTQPVTVTTEPSGLTTITTTYNGSATVPTNAGSYTVVSSLSNANYQADPATGTLVINKADPVITWSNPSAITYGTALSGAQLNASPSVAGTLTYLPPSGTVLNAGTHTLVVNFVPTDGTNYNTINGTSVTLVVNKATATINVTGYTQEYDGNPKPVTVTTTPAGLGVIAVTYDGSSTAPTAVGSYAVVVTLTNTNYTATPAGGTLVISASAADVTITDLIKTYTGSPLSPTVTVDGGWPYDLTFDGSATVPTNVGTYEVIATINDGIHFGADTADFEIIKATPSITWSNPATITYGTALSGTQLNASSATAGTFTYTPASGTVLNAGSQILSVVFTPTDAANYNSTNKTVTLVVNQATATLTLSNTTQIYDGTPKAVTVTSSPAGLTVIDVTYDGSGTEPTNVGTYAVVASLTNPNYIATPATGNLIISTANAAIVISNTNQTYDGTTQPVTVTTNPSGLSHTVTYNGSGTVPTNAGSYTVIATITGGVYTGADTATLIINKATPTITWSNPSAITYGTSLSGTQLNASTGLAGTFTYVPASGAILNAGTQNLTVTFTPTDATNYNTVQKTVTIVVNKAVATISLSNLTQVYDGTPKSATATTSPVGLDEVAITYDGSPTAPTAVGTYDVEATLTNSNYTATPATGTLEITTSAAAIEISNILQTYTGSNLPVTVTTNPSGLTYTVTYNGSATVPTSAGSYTVIATLTGGTYTGADTATYVIAKATPTITWNNPTSIVYGTALSGTQLNATSSVAGTFAYSPASGSVLNAGTQNLSTTFTPTDAGNYNVVTKIVTIDVTANTSATLTLSGLSATYTGNPIPVVVTTSPSGLSGVTITYNGSPTVPTNAGTYNVQVSLNNANYTASPVSGTLTIAKASPLLAWRPIAPIKKGTPLTTTQLNATANIAGTFTYNYPIGTILPVGTNALRATFTPASSNYAVTQITNRVSVVGNPHLQYYIINGRTIYLETNAQ